MDNWWLFAQYFDCATVLQLKILCNRRERRRLNVTGCVLTEGKRQNSCAWRGSKSQSPNKEMPYEDIRVSVISSKKNTWIKQILGNHLRYVRFYSFPVLYCVLAV
jgi:hypothetical protein